MNIFFLKVEQNTIKFERVRITRLCITLKILKNWQTWVIRDFGDKGTVFNEEACPFSHSEPVPPIHSDNAILSLQITTGLNY